MNDEPERTDVPPGLEAIGEFMNRAFGDSFNNAGVISFLKDVEEQARATRWHQNQVDTIWKAKCPDFKTIDELAADRGETTRKMNVFNNIITDESSFAKLMEQTRTEQGGQQTTPTTPVQPRPRRGWPASAKIGMLTAGLLGVSGLAAGAAALLRPQPEIPKFADLSGIEVEGSFQSVDIEGSGKQKVIK